VLFELDDKRPVRYRCHTGHAFSLRSLAATQEQVTDSALWTGLRALQEKEAILRRLAAGAAPGDPVRRPAAKRGRRAAAVSVRAAQAHAEGAEPGQLRGVVA
jgi:hypothetical protein